MKKSNICAFLCGALVTTIVFSAVVTASATFENIIFSGLNFTLNGKAVFEKGDTIELSSGQKIPSSILFVDETGGGTTYLPARTIAELLEMPIKWDPETGTVNIGRTITEVSSEELLQEMAEQWLLNGDYPKNDKGETYGPEILSSIVGHMPDLVSAAATNGQSGYLRNSELEAFYSSFDGQDNSLPVYDLDGNVIGEFVFEDGPALPE